MKTYHGLPPLTSLDPQADGRGRALPETTRPMLEVIELLQRCLDPDVVDLNAVSAAQRFALGARQHGLTFNVLANALGRLVLEARPCRRVRAPRPAGNVQMPWGVHKGRSLAEIVVDNPDYIRWLSRECRDLFLQRAARRTWRVHFGGRAA